MQTISVTPADAGWAVRSEAIVGPLLFRSGAKAEAAAKRLAQALAAVGDPVRIDISLRNGQPGGRYLFDPEGASARALVLPGDPA
ncbi:MAG: hypothetical protein IT546_09125 [Caulobacteraceae bacterium]|nr:hypothetical protein [Caulobacteraceae bacterium]